MFAQHSIRIGRPIAEISAALAGAPDGWLPSLIGPSPAGNVIAGFGLRKKVTIKVGKPVTAGPWTEIPVTWQASYIKKLFPLMTGSIQIEPIGDRATTLTVGGSYELSPGRLVEHLDDVLMQRVAEATVKELAEIVVTHLEAA
jgi:hypothetical protein